MTEKPTPLFQGMTLETAEKYIKAREKADPQLDEIHALGNLLKLLHHLPPDLENAELSTLGTIGEMITKRVLAIFENLEEDFIYLPRLKRELAR